MDFRHSQTWRNLKQACEREWRASGQYRLFADRAREDGYEHMGALFDETARNEQEHAQLWWRYLRAGEDPATQDLLIEAASGEHHEWTSLYQAYAATARQEGFDHLADLFDQVATVERNHDRRFRRLAENLQGNRVFCQEEERVWVCGHCGCLTRGACAPAYCPVCRQPQGAFSLYCENF